MSGKWIHNASGGTKTYEGVPISDGAFFEIPGLNLIKYAMNSSLIADIANGLVFMSSNGTSNNISTVSKQIDFLKGLDLTPRDTDGSPIIRGKTTEPGWHFEPRYITFQTSKFGSLHNRKHNGDDLADADLRFWDSEDDELVQGEEESDEAFQTRLDGACVKTTMDWHTSYDFDIRGGIVLTGTKPTNPCFAFAIIAPDIPENMGGQVPYLSGGFPIHLLASNSYIEFDGITAKRITADHVYDSSKFRTIFKHALGDKIDLAVCFQQYKA